MGTKLVTAIVLGYLAFLTLLLVWILLEAVHTGGWSEDATASHSVVIAMAAMGGWFDKVFAILNFLLGLGGGFIAERESKVKPRSRLRPALLVFTLIIAVLALTDLTWVAYAFDDIGKNLLAFRDGPLKVSDAVGAIGVIHLGLVAGVLAGVGLHTAKT